MYVADLTQERTDAGTLVYVGYLSPEHPYATGTVSADFFERLCRIIQSPLPHVISAGVGRCELCQFSCGQGSAQYKDYLIPFASSSDVYVSGQGLLYVSPGVVAHYIDAHRYRPPEQFIDAMIACPAPRTPQYRKALLANGGRHLFC